MKVITIRSLQAIIVLLQLFVLSIFTKLWVEGITRDIPWLSFLGGVGMIVHIWDILDDRRTVFVVKRRLVLTKVNEPILIFVFRLDRLIIL